MASRVTKTRVPRWIRVFNRIARPLLAIGVPMGDLGLITVSGRRTGVPRTTPIALVEISGKLWIVSPWGDVDWVRNLRAAHRATMAKGRTREEVTAVELSPGDRVAFFRDLVNPFLRGKWLATWIVRNVDGIGEDPVEAARDRVVFELRSRRSPER